jgi:protein-tyrosine kinase
MGNKSVYKRDETIKRMQRLQLNEESVSKEQIRMIRANIEQKLDKDSNSFMLTSPTQDGDKSIISSKLALSFAEQGKKVLLVDANLRKPTLHNWFNLTNETGLTNVIMKGENLQLHSKETFFPGLYVLPTGPIPLNLSDIWITNKIKEMARKCQSEFEIVIYEAPPFLTVSDSHMLVNQCDGVILVVRANKTKKEEALKTKEYIERTSKRILGVIYQTG